MFKLTEEQINYIIEMYGGSKSVIECIEERLNLIDVIEFEDDYLEVVCSVVSQNETIKNKLSKCKTREEKLSVFMSLDQIIGIELNRKYNNFEDSKPSIKQKIKKFY